MRNGKKPTRQQKIRLGKYGLSPKNWLVIKTRPDNAMVVRHKRTNQVLIISALDS